MRRIALYFGSFNPIHLGHTAIAEYVYRSGVCDEVWLIVSPQNPLKSPIGIAPEQQRYEMACAAVADKLFIKISDVEFSLPKPSYTIDTLSVLHDTHPDCKFSIIMGGDNLSEIEKWKNFHQLLDNNNIYIYVRNGFTGGKYFSHPNVTVMTDAPLLDISSTEVRQKIAEDRDVSNMIEKNVEKYIKIHKLYGAQ